MPVLADVTPADPTPYGFGVYIHWPFCQAKCPYCDFNSHVAERIDHARWQRALLAQVDRHAAAMPGRTVTSIFFGGGTPSLMQPEVVAAIIARIGKAWQIAADVEITLEANPTSAESGRFSACRDAGVNRVSIGIQSLEDDSLRRLGRRHDVAEARSAFEMARRIFDRVSFDLIYARQDQTTADWRRELGEGLAMAADHLSLYQLTIEDGTPFAARLARGGLNGLPDDDRAADLFDVTQDMCDAAGMPAYETSNHATPGAPSIHNLTYWRCGDYVGIGPGAHGRLSAGGVRLATESTPAPEAWLLASESLLESVDTVEVLSERQQGTEMLIMGLRVAEGVDLRRLERTSPGLLDVVAAGDLADQGLLMLDDGRLRLTRRGRPLLDAILRELIG